MCYEIDQKLGEPAGCRWFLNWYDETSREQMRKELSAEVGIALDIRERGYELMPTLYGDSDNPTVCDPDNVLGLKK
jgi:hypothetical protein